MLGSAAVILCYHKVGPESEEGRSLNIEPARLDSHIRFFKRRGLPFVLGRQFAPRWPGQSVCLTFDDAYVSALTHGREVMLRNEVRGVFYVVSTLVGDASRWDGDKARPLAGQDLLKTALDEGFELGNHTARHARLANIDSGVRRELEECRDWLERFGAGEGSFCYPYGSLDDAAVEEVSRAGYGVGMALGKRVALPTDNRLRLPRIVVAFSHSLPMLVYKVYVRSRWAHKA